MKREVLKNILRSDSVNTYPVYCQLCGRLVEPKDGEVGEWEIENECHSSCAERHAEAAVDEFENIKPGDKIRINATMNDNLECKEYTVAHVGENGLFVWTGPREYALVAYSSYEVVGD